jgi:putative tryptophan/tyrosine transport system substrate-binding protein
MKRRAFITLLSGAAAWPIAARAQQQGKLPTIGFLGADASGWRPWTDAFVTRLRELGWIEGRTVAIEYRWDEGRPERDSDTAAEFLRLNVDVAVTNTVGALTLKQKTSAIPIVFVLANDPLGDGLVTNLPHPGANVTGLSLQSNDLATKRLQFLSDAVPRLRRLAILADINHPDGAELDQVDAAARRMGLDTTHLEIRRATDIAPAFEMLKGEANALYAVNTALIGANRTRIITFALVERLPTMFGAREFPQAGALMAYGPSYPDQFRRAADYVDKILRGAKPGDIPVEQPTRFYLTLNLTTAKALRLEVPPSLLAIADEVIE